MQISITVTQTAKNEGCHKGFIHFTGCKGCSWKLPSSEETSLIFETWTFWYNEQFLWLTIIGLFVGKSFNVDWLDFRINGSCNYWFEHRHGTEVTPDCLSVDYLFRWMIPNGTRRLQSSNRLASFRWTPADEVNRSHRRVDKIVLSEQ